MNVLLSASCRFRSVHSVINYINFPLRTSGSRSLFTALVARPKTLATKVYDTKLIGCHFNKPKTFPFPCSQTKQFSISHVFRNQSPLNVNTNVVKDVILYRYENGSFYRILNVFAICQFLFWAYLSHFAYTSLKDTPIDRGDVDELPWWRKINLGDNKYRNGITILCFVIGYGILAAAWAFTLKSVRFLILRKGGESVTFVTYGPYGKNRMMTVPINMVSCQEGRTAARVQLPVKVKGSYLYYILDMRGEFTNPHLFDFTVGLKRMWKT